MGSKEIRGVDINNRLSFSMKGSYSLNDMVIDVRVGLS